MPNDKSQKAALNSIDKTTTSLAQNLNKHFGPKLPSKKGEEDKADPVLLDVLCGIVGLLSGETGTVENVKGLINKSKTSIFGSLNTILAQFKESKQSFLFNTLLDQEKSTKYWTETISAGIKMALETNKVAPNIGKIILEADKDLALVSTDGKMNIFEILEIISNVDDKKLKNKVISLHEFVEKDLKDFIEDVNNLKFNESELPDQNTIDAVIGITNMLDTFSKSFPKDITTIDDSKLDSIIYSLSVMLMAFKKDDGLIGKSIQNIIEISDNDVKKIQIITAYLDELDKLAIKLNVIGKLEPGVMAGIQTMKKAYEGIGELLESINDIEINEKKLKEVNQAVNSLLKVVIASGVILLTGAAVMSLINPLDLAAFSYSLTSFTFSLLWTYKTAAKDLQNAFGVGKDLAYLVAISGLVLILGAAVVESGIIWPALLFAVELDLFIFTLIGIVSLYKDKIPESLEALDSFAELVIVAGLTLVLGGLMMKVIDPVSLLIFAGVLAGFITLLLGAVVGSIWLAGKIAGFTGDTVKILGRFMQVLGKFSLFVMLAGFTLLLGGMLINFVNIPGLILFTVVLAGFAISLLVTFSLLKRQITVAFEGAFKFSLLLLLSSAILMFGGWFFTKFPELIPGTFLFALVLGGFIMLISGAFGTFNGENLFPKVIGFALVVALSGILLLYAGNLFLKDPNLAWAVALFAVTLSGFVWLMGLAMKTLEAANIGPASIIAMAVIAGVIFVAALAFEKIANIVNMLGGPGGVIEFVVICGVLFGLITALSLVVVGLGLLLGNGPITAMVLLAVGVLLAAAAAIWVVCDAFEKIVDSLDKLSKIGKIDIKQLIDPITGMTDLVAALAPLAASAPQIIAVSLALTMMGVMMDKLAESVANYAALKVPIYRGTEIVGYRQLKKTDFKNAATNISIIITTLGSAIIKTYDKNPEIFETNLFGVSKFAKVVSSLKTLGPLIDKIADSVKDYADLKVKLYEGTKVVGYRHLTKEDFTNAATNVTTIIEVLGSAIIKAYEAHPDYYEGGGPGWFSKGSKFAQTVSSNITLAQLLTSISKAVKDYANMTVFDEYVYDPKTNQIIPKGTSRHLTSQDFTDAATNVTTIISLLGGAIVRAYDANPEYYEGGSGGWFSKGSKFAQTVSSNLTLAKLLSGISKAVKDYANMTVFDEYVYDTQANKIVPKGTSHRLTNEDFTNAGMNVTSILSTLGGAIVKAYEEHPNYYETEFLSSSNIFTRTIKSNIELADLLSKIAGAVKDYANMTVFEEYVFDPESKKIIPKGSSRQLKREDFSKAADNIKLILSTLGNAIIQTYNTNKSTGLYDGGGLFGWGDSPFEKVIESNMQLADLIAKISKGVKDYANLTITEYEIDKDGKLVAKSVRSMTNTDFTNAATNIKDLITILGKSIIESFNEHKDWFDDGEDSDFAMASKAIGTMGDMIAKIAQGIQGYANLKMPDFSQGFDENGNPKAYQQLGPDVFTKAGEHIQQLLGTVGETLVNFYKQHPQYFDDGDDSVFMVIANSTAKMGEMLSNMSSALSSYAELKIPIKWNEEGTPTDFKNMTDAEIQKAGENIGMIVSIMGASLMALYDGKRISVNNGKISFINNEFSNNIAKELFKTSKDNPNSILSQIVDTCSDIGSMIEEIATGIQTYATLEVPIYKDGKISGYRILHNDDFTNAATNISKIITTIGGALVKTFKNHTNLFGVNLNPGTGFNGMTNTNVNKSTKNSSDVTPFEHIVNSVAKLGAVISNIAEGVQQFAAMRMPIYKDGKLTGYEKLDDTMYGIAEARISKLISSIGQTFINLYNNDHKGLFKPMQEISLGGFMGLIAIDTKQSNQTPFDKMVVSVAKLGRVITNIADGVRNFASSYVPIYDSNHKVTQYKPIGQTEFDKSKKLISEIITHFATTFDETYKSHQSLFDDIVAVDVDLSIASFWGIGKSLISSKHTDSPIARVMNASIKIGTIISSIADAIIKLTSSTVIIKDENGKPVEKTLGTKDFIEAGVTIGSILSFILDEFGKQAEKPVFKENGDAVKTITKIVGEATNIVSTLAQSIVQFSSMRFPTGEFESDGKTPKYQRITDTELTKSANNIGKVIGNVLKGIKEAISNQEILEMLGTPTFLAYIDVYGKSKTPPEPPIMKAIKMIANITSPLATLADIIVKLAGNQIVEQEFDKNGQLIKSKTTYFKPDDVTKAKINLTTIITTLLTTASKLYDHNKQNLYKFNIVRNNLNEFINTIKSLIEVGKSVGDIDTKRFNDLGDGAAYIANKFNNITANEAFKNHTEQLSKYVKVINSISIVKLNKLQSFAASMNELSKRMGNLDKLTDAISNTLTGELNKLSQELSFAANVINEAEQIQDKRHKLIKQEAETIEKLLSKHLTVDIQNVSDKGSLTNTPGTTVYRPSSTNSAGESGVNEDGTNNSSSGTSSTITSDPSSTDKYANYFGNNGVNENSSDAWSRPYLSSDINNTTTSGGGSVGQSTKSAGSTDEYIIYNSKTGVEHPDLKIKKK